MKKSKLLALGLIALVLAGGLVLASCGDFYCAGKGCNDKVRYCPLHDCHGTYTGCKCADFWKDQRDKANTVQECMYKGGSSWGQKELLIFSAV